MPSKPSKPKWSFLKGLKRLLNEFASLEDIFLFGSSVKGKSAKEFDLALILKNKSEIEKIKPAIRKIIKNVDIQIVDSIYHPLWIILIREGFSLRKNRFLYELYHLQPVVLYKYSLKKLGPTQKVQFTRGLKNLLETSRAKVLSRSILLIPLTHKCLMEKFLETWGIKYEAESYELFPVMRKEEF